MELPAKRWLIIEDNPSIYTNQETRLALSAWPEIQTQFIPQYDCWLNLIELWGKQLRSLALKGRRFNTLDELLEALNANLDYWNRRRCPYHWKKQPQEQVPVLGDFGVLFAAQCLGG